MNKFYTKRYIGLKDKEYSNIDSNGEYFLVYDWIGAVGNGKHSFLLDIKDDMFVKNSEIKIEILDSHNNPIYHEAPKYLEGNLRRISFRIDENTPKGVATLYIAGILKKDTKDKWYNKYNIIFSKTFSINNSLPNNSPVRFYNPPTVTIAESKEVIKTINNRTYDNIELNIPSGKISSIDKRIYFEVLTDGIELSKYMVKGKLYISINTRSVSSNLEWDIFGEDDINDFISQEKIFELDIIDVPSKKIIELNYKNYNFLKGVNSLTDSKITYTKLNNVDNNDNYYTLNETPMLNINLDNLNTFSGNIKRSKLYVKSKNNNDLTYQIIDDSLLDKFDSMIMSEHGESVGLFNPSNYGKY